MKMQWRQLWKFQCKFNKEEVSAEFISYKLIGRGIFGEGSQILTNEKLGSGAF